MTTETQRACDCGPGVVECEHLADGRIVSLLQSVQADSRGPGQWPGFMVMVRCEGDPSHKYQPWPTPHECEFTAIEERAYAIFYEARRTLQAREGT